MRGACGKGFDRVGHSDTLLFLLAQQRRIAAGGGGIDRHYLLQGEIKT
jgi:hypothetical protein